MTKETQTGASSAGGVPHPALGATNISSLIRDPLETGKGLYTTWAELFKTHARIFLVLDHILLATDNKSEISSSVMKVKDPSLWSRVDSVVLQWIYATISSDLLNSIIASDQTAEAAWSRLAEIFSDNKNSRALYLKQELSNTKLAIGQEEKLEQEHESP